jgi:hypothetical protein
MADSPMQTPFLAQLATLTNSNFICAGKYYVRKFYLSENSWSSNPGPLIC